MPGRWWLSRPSPRWALALVWVAGRAANQSTNTCLGCALDGHVSSSLAERPKSSDSQSASQRKRKSCSEEGDARNRPKEEGAGETRR